MNTTPVTLIINARFDPDDPIRQENLEIVLNWIDKLFDDKFDILIIEQDSIPRLKLSTLSGNFRHEFIYNPSLFNRGWGFNVAVERFCPDSIVVVFLDTDILPNKNLTLCIKKCLEDYDVVSPYKNIYYSSESERRMIAKTLDVDFEKQTMALSNPVTISGGILIIKKELFRKIYGFEQYIGYGGEDRALDVTLLATVTPDKISISNDVYIHLYHPRDKIDKSETEKIMRHLGDTYGCRWAKEIQPHDYIHRQCRHKKWNQIEFAVKLKKHSYGDVDLYRKQQPLTINGISTRALANIRYLAESKIAENAEQFELSLHHLKWSSLSEPPRPEILLKAAFERRRHLAKKKFKKRLYDFVFIPHKRYHTFEFIEIVKELQCRGYSAVLVNPSPPHPEEGAFVTTFQSLFITYDSLLTSDCLPKCIVCANDWERPVVLPLLKAANFHNIPTVALVEGVNDFHDVDTRVPGSPAHYRNAYGVAKNIILNGEYDKKYFTSTSQRIFIGGISRLTKLRDYRLKRLSRSAPRKCVLINLNFSYNVQSRDAEKWLDNVVYACQHSGYDFIISRHPQDQTPVRDYAVSSKPLYDDLAECYVFVTRFSGAVFEALTIGAPVIYFNPLIERNDKFTNPMGAYKYVTTLQALISELQGVDITVDARASDFLAHHVGGDPTAHYAPHLRCADILMSIVESNNVSVETAKRFIRAARNYYDVYADNYCLVTHDTAVIDHSETNPLYIIGDNVVMCKCLNPDIENLHERVIQSRGNLYVLKADPSPELLLIEPSVWNEQAPKKSEIVIHVIDFDISAIDVTGFCFDLGPIGRVLKPGLTFLIRAKNERKNIFFVLGSLRAVLRNKRLNCEVVFVDNKSTDGTYEEVIRICRAQEIENVFLYKYNVDISTSGDEHASLSARNEMGRSLNVYYNWCLKKANKYNIIKWDADFLAINDNLIEMVETFQLNTTSSNLAVWCTGKTLFKNGDLFFINDDSWYNEFRVFSKFNAYEWVYAPRWEIPCPNYMAASTKMFFSKAVFLELKDAETNEFANRSNAVAIASCARDTRDGRIIDLLRSSEFSEKALDGAGVEANAFDRLNFNPLSPVNYDTASLNSYCCTMKELIAAQSYWVNVYSRPETPITFKFQDNIVIQGLWVGPAISDLHRLCIQSFINAGHCFVLYTYGAVGNVPPGVVVMSAAEFVPRDLIYSYQDSYAGFSDLFRSKLMEAKGGWYVDLDIYCLKKIDIENKVVFSLDHYPEKGPVVYSKDGVKIMPVRGGYYCATNPLKMQCGSVVTRWMYSTVLKKIISKKIFLDVFGGEVARSVPRSDVIRFLHNIGIFDDYIQYIGDPSNLGGSITFQSLIGNMGISVDEVGQNTWNDIGPKLVSEAAVKFGSDDSLFDPIWFQGLIPYYEVEKYVTAGYDFSLNVAHENACTVDLFFTMWKKKNLLSIKDSIDNTFYKFLERRALPNVVR
jgi:glycosyltransferase involved in cell wall biosynthesis